jgi:TatD DNase family protein
MKPEYFDIHAHVNFAAYNADQQEVLKRAQDAGVWIINIGAEEHTSDLALTLAKEYELGVYAAVGLHPTHTAPSFHDAQEFGEEQKLSSRGELFDGAKYEKLATDPKVVAIGECGLDYYRLDEHSVSLQKEAFEAQIDLANRVSKPLMLHIRQGKEGPRAYKDALEILRSSAKVLGNAHFFAGSWEEAREFLSIGFTLSFNGVITFAREYDEVIKNSPLDMIMTETDCPYITPVPYRGKRNEPLYVREVVKKIAQIREEDFDKVKMAMVGNAFRSFLPS